MVISMSTTEKLSCKANITTNRLNNTPPFGVSTREEEPIAFTTEMTPKVDGGGIAFSLRSRDYKDAQCIAVQINGNYRAKRDCSEPNCREN